MEGVREDIIITALEEMEQGQPIEEILERYPQYAGDLRPILETTTGLGQLVTAPSAKAQQTSRDSFLAEAQHLRQSSQSQKAMPPWRRFFYSFASLAILVVLLGIIVVPPAADAIPGDILYPVKRSAESAQLFLAPASEKEALRADFEQERNYEVYEMLEVGRDGRAGYVGVIKAIDDDAWEIGRITALINDETVIIGDPEVGARVEAHCLVEDGQVIAESLVILEPSPEISPTAP